MRRIIVEGVRRRRRLKRGGDRVRMDAGEFDLALKMPDERLLAIDEAVGKLDQEDPSAAAIVMLRFYSGMSISEAADALGATQYVGQRQAEGTRFELATPYRAPHCQSVAECPETREKHVESCRVGANAGAVASYRESIDRDLQTVIEGWSRLPEEVKAAILVIIRNV